MTPQKPWYKSGPINSIAAAVTLLLGADAYEAIRNTFRLPAISGEVHTAIAGGGIAAATEAIRRLRNRDREEELEELRMYKAQVESSLPLTPRFSPQPAPQDMTPEQFLDGVPVALIKDLGAVAPMGTIPGSQITDLEQRLRELDSLAS